jgi:hypothetical protein
MMNSLGGTGWYFIIGVGLIFQGFISYSLLNVCGLVLENLIAIRKLLSGDDKRFEPTVAARDDPSS